MKFLVSDFPPAFEIAIHITRVSIPSPGI